MPSTTDSKSCCEFCGKERAPIYMQSFIGRSKLAKAYALCEFPGGMPLTLVAYRSCDCPQAVEANAVKQRQQEAEQREKEKVAYYARLKKAGVKERYIKAKHEDAARYAKEVEGGKSFYFWGEFGTGKTYLASAIVRKLVWDKKGVRMLTGIDLVMELQATFGSPTSEADVMARFKNCDVLVIDDMGKEPPSDWVLSRLFAVINARYDAMLPVIITANYERSKLIERLGKHGDHDTAEAMVSRLCEMSEVVHIGGGDRRLA